MKKRIKQRLYTLEDYRHIDGHLVTVTLPEGNLYANGQYPTKIKASDLPEWFVYGRFYKRFGYLSAKGITDMIYVPNTWVNHFLKDDDLFIAYGGKITQNPASDHLPAYQKYTGWDEWISGNEILRMLKAAEKYSAYDISSFGPQLKEKIRMLKQNYPMEFRDSVFDVDEWLASEFKPTRG